MIQIAVTAVIGVLGIGYLGYRWWNSDKGPSQGSPDQSKKSVTPSPADSSPPSVTGSVIGARTTTSKAETQCHDSKTSTSDKIKAERPDLSIHIFGEPDNSNIKKYFTPKHLGISLPPGEITSQDLLNAACIIDLSNDNLARSLRCDTNTIENYRIGSPILKIYRHYELCKTFVSLSNLLQKELGNGGKGKKNILSWVNEYTEMMTKSPPIRDINNPGLDHVYFLAYERFGP